MTHENDLYPSRVDAPARIIKRQDKTIYSPYSNNAPLTQEQWRQYDTNGFLVIPNLFTEEEVSSFVAELEALRCNSEIVNCDETITEPSSNEVRSIFRVHQLSSLYRQAASDPRILNRVQYLLNDDVYIHQSRLNYKPGFRGKEFYWHSDFETWHVEDGMPRMRALSVSIALTDNYAFNGPLMLIPGSHQHYISCPGSTPENNYRNSLRQQVYGTPPDEFLSQMFQDKSIVSANGQAGMAIFFDCNIMHGSNSNISPAPRSNLFFVYNSISNKLTTPFCNKPPRPEHIATRKSIERLRVNREK